MSNTDDKQNYFNNVVIIGRAGSDAELRYFESGKAKATVNLAVTRRRAREGVEEITDWFRVDFWERDAEVAGEYLKKGTLVCVDGRLGCNRWKDLNSGEEREAYYIIANSFRLLSSRREAQSF